jgi:hypothetical protein
VVLDEADRQAGQGRGLPEGLAAGRDGPRGALDRSPRRLLYVAGR